MKNFPYPLPAYALTEFCHPRPTHDFHVPVRHEKNILAANGYLAIQASRGNWLDEDFPTAPSAFLTRFNVLPWDVHKAACDKHPWTHLHDIKGTLNERGQIGLWLKQRLAPSPVWRVRDAFVYLSFLQLIARLPRAEVFHGPQALDAPLFFRFSGGVGMIPANPKLLTNRLSSRSILQPATDCFTGERIEKRTIQPQGFSHSGTMKNWPPPPPID